MDGGERSRSRSRCVLEDVFAFGGMVMIECMVVGGNTLYKSTSAQGINSYVFTFYGFLFLLPFFFVTYRIGIPTIKLSTIGKLFLLSVLVYLSQVFGYIGLWYSSPTLSSIMSNLSPAFTFILAFFFRMEKIHIRSYTSKAKIIGTTVSVIGAFIATLYSGPSLLQDSMSINWIIGGIFFAIQSFLSAFALVALANIMMSYTMDLMTVFVFNLSGLFVAGFGGLVMTRDLDEWKLKPNIILATILYMGLSSGLLNLVIQFWILRIKGPVYVAMFKPLTIVIAILMGVLFLGDFLQLGSVVGGALVILGFYAVVWGKSGEETTPATQTSAPLLHQQDDLEKCSGST